MKAIADVQQIQGMVRERNMLFNALVNLFQACSELCWEDMDKLEKQIAEASYAIKHAAQQSVQLTGGTLPDFQADSTPEVLSGLEADTTPPTSN